MSFHSLRLIVWAVATISLSGTGPAALAACKGEWEGAGKPIPFRHGLAESDRQALSAMVHLALDDPAGVGEWPQRDISDAPPCELSTFEADGATWTISGGAAPAPARWIQTTGRQQLFFIAKAPPLADARQWAFASTPWVTVTGPPLYLLVGLAEDHHFVFRVYDDVPGLKLLADDLVAILNGTTAPLAALDRLGSAVSIFLETETGRTAEFYRPGTLGGDRSASLFGPDGYYFAPLPAGLVSLRGSGLYCAYRSRGFTRARLLAIDLHPQTLNLGCSFEGRTDDLVTVFSQRADDVSDDKAYVSQQLEMAETRTGVRQRLGRSSLGGAVGYQWIDKAGVHQGLWIRRNADFLIEVHATYGEGSRSMVSDFVEALLLNQPPATAEDEPTL